MEEADEGLTPLARAARMACRCAISLKKKCANFEVTYEDKHTREKVTKALTIHAGVGVGSMIGFRVGTKVCHKIRKCVYLWTH